MECLVIGFLVSLGWHIARMLVGVIEETLFSNLHEAKWYQRLNKKTAKPKVDTTDGVVRKIGFV